MAWHSPQNKDYMWPLQTSPASSDTTLSLTPALPSHRLSSILQVWSFFPVCSSQKASSAQEAYLLFSHLPEPSLLPLFHQVCLNTLFFRSLPQLHKVGCPTSLNPHVSSKSLLQFPLMPCASLEFVTICFILPSPTYYCKLHKGKDHFYFVHHCTPVHLINCLKKY